MMKIVRSVVMVVVAGGVLGGAQVPKGGVAVDPTATDPEPAYSSTKRVPEPLLDGGRRPVVILPSEPGEPGELPTQRTSGVVAKLPSETHRLPEGYVVGARPARIELQGKWYVASLLPQEGLVDAPPMRLLPNQQLAIIEAVLARTRETPQFLLTGRVTEFQGTNYLLIEHTAEVLPVHDQPAMEPPKPQVPPTPSAPTATSAEARTVDKTQAREPTAQEIIKQLMDSKPVRQVVLPETTGEKPASDAKTAGANQAPIAGSRTPATPETQAARQGTERRTWYEGALVMDQLGRFVSSDEFWWSLAFEDPGFASGQAGFRLLPNRLLETALALSGGTGQGGVFMVSGEVTTYKGADYLLLRKVLVRRDMGNFR